MIKHAITLLIFFNLSLVPCDKTPIEKDKQHAEDVIYHLIKAWKKSQSFFYSTNSRHPTITKDLALLVSAFSRHQTQQDENQTLINAWCDKWGMRRIDIQHVISIQICLSSMHNSSVTTENSAHYSLDSITRVNSWHKNNLNGKDEK